jgi:signal transduction histidine kinase
LAHSLSGLSIQLEGARRLAQNDKVNPELGAVIERAAALAKQGVVEARTAVGALRDDDLRTVERLPDLVEQYRRDLGLVVNIAVEGEARAISPDVTLALYRALGEALTNIGRYAPGTETDVLVQWAPEEIHLRVEDQGALPGATPEGPSGGGWGLVGMRERVQRLGGRCVVGPAGRGWVVDIVLPA